MSTPTKVLFLCTGNSCRSIMAEAILNHLGKDRFLVMSAGSKPAGNVHPKSLSMLKSKGIQTAGLRSKSWDEFGSAPFDIVITVCDQAAGESCPVFFGAPTKAHWSIPDPAHAIGTDAEAMEAFKKAYDMLETRITALVLLPLTEMDKQEISDKLKAIGNTIT